MPAAQASQAANIRTATLQSGSSGYTAIFYILAILSVLGGIIGMIGIPSDGMRVMALIGGLVQGTLFAALGKAMEYLALTHAF